MPRSSIDVYVRLRKYENDDTTDDSTTSSSATSSSTSIIKLLRLHNYLNIPPPRTIQYDLIKEQLMEQYPHEIQSIDDIESISFKPIMHMPESFDTALVDKDSTISVNNQPQNSGFDCNETGSRSQLGGENHEPLEKSFRWPRTCTKSSSTT
ncbi:hypothetical protein IV203_027903 [Nitzschia inconspicua]|uniref:Uncharacterized protein n=1 Tax=Nitzschia inconspicua TaxID=303405 RepID=A0A9K3LXJ6_9STRA|nr:hypothetical protein IV203_027903 [Nitzschia inconspicua]